MLRMKYVWTLLMVVVFAAMASTMACAQWIQVDYDEPLVPTSGPEATGDSTATFSDVDTGHPFWGYIEECAAAASASSDYVVAGFGDGSYQPTWQVNRAAMAVFVQRAAGYTDDPPGTPSFDDVPDSYWAFSEIEACVTNGVVQGYPDGLYRPTQTVNRAQMAVYMVNATGGTSAAYTAGFDDVDADYWAAGYIQTCVDDYIVQGYPDNFYRPERIVNRGEMSVFVWRALVDDVVLNDPVGTTDTAVDPGGPDTAALFAPAAVSITGAADADLAEGVFVYVVLDAYKVATGNVTFEVYYDFVNDNGTPADDTDDFDDVSVEGTASVAVTAGAYDAAIDAGNLPYLVASYEIESGLPAEDYTVTVELPNGAVFEAGTFTVP